MKNINVKLSFSTTIKEEILNYMFKLTNQENKQQESL